MKEYVDVIIKDKKHESSVIKKLHKAGYIELKVGDVLKWLIPIKTITVYSDGTYQPIATNIHSSQKIKPKDLMNSKPVKYFMEHKHV